MTKTTPEQNRAIVLEAIETLLNKHDYAAERFWSPAYIQHSAVVAPGREGLLEFVKVAPRELHYEIALIVAATMSWSTAGFQGSGSQRTGSWSTSYVSKTA
jgi:predicted SnoaL-like aldol condensation-catalyzing enzyme